MGHSSDVDMHMLETSFLLAALGVVVGMGAGKDIPTLQTNSRRRNYYLLNLDTTVDSMGFHAAPHIL